MPSRFPHPEQYGGGEAAQRSPKLLLSSLPLAFRVATNYGELQREWMGPKHGRLLVKHDFMPTPFHEGVVRGLLTSMRAVNIQVQGRQTGELDSECAFSWE